MYTFPQYHWKAFLSLKLINFSLLDWRRQSQICSNFKRSIRRPENQIEMEVENQNKTKDWSKAQKQHFWSFWDWSCWLDLKRQLMDLLCVMLQMFLPIQLPTLWDAVFIEFSLAHFLWLSYQPTRASSFLKYSANLKEESRFWEKIWYPAF